jgi:putative SOS response-associated peptidase YedK
MCGRFGLSATPEQLALLLDIAPGDIPKMSPRYNIAPSTLTPIVRHNAEGGRRVHPVRWGLVPSWAKALKIGHRMINARAETVAQKPAFRSAFKRRRCLVLTDGFYEWKPTPEGKQPHHFGLADDSPFALAGLWERWQPDEDADPLDTFTIVTTEANPVVAPVHHRMPVILSPGDYDTWLDRDTPPEVAHALLGPCPPDAMVRWPVSTLVNSPRNDDPRCRELVESV